ncbi:MAG: transposase [Alphaproteobacteria bacterium]|nr:transposase [Alphaproteobacteria bacterium]
MSGDQQDGPFRRSAGVPVPSRCRRLPRSFNASFRDECLNGTLFSSLAQARADLTAWKEHYNTNRPHSSFGDITPSEFAIKMAMENHAA